MSTYSDKTFNAKHYDNARPTYPDSFYQCLLEYHRQASNAKLDNLIDVGCGTGIVTFEMVKYFNNVIGTDLSSTMIEQCNQLIPRKLKTQQHKISFLVAGAEAFPSQIAENSTDMITAAECIHWVNHDEFFRESHRILKPDGTLAYWFYKDPVFIGVPEANDLYDEYCYGDQYMGPYWQQPGRNYLRTLMKEVPVPTELFTDIERHEYLVDNNGKPIANDSTTLSIRMRVKLIWWENYIKSWSAYHSWMKENGQKYDIAEKFVQELKQKLHWNDDTEVDLVWDTMYTFARKK